MITAAAKHHQRLQRRLILSRTLLLQHQASFNNAVASLADNDKEESSSSSPKMMIDMLSQEHIHFKFHTHPVSSPYPQSAIYSYSSACREGLHHQQRRLLSFSSSYSPSSSMTDNNSPGMTPDKVLAYLESRDVDTNRYRLNGSHIILRECPFCEKPTNGKADNMYKCYIRINHGSAVYHCHRCGSGGSWYDLKKRLGDFQVDSISQVARQGGPGSRALSTVAAPQASGNEWQSSNFSVSTSSSSSSSYGGSKHQQQSSYGSPKVQTPPLPDFTKRGYEDYLKPPPSHPQHGRNPAPLPMPTQRLQALYSTELLDAPDNGDASSSSSTVLQYLTEVRGLSLKTLRKYGVGKASYRFPTDDNQWTTADCVTFPWIMSVSQVERQETLRGSKFEWTAPKPPSPPAETQDESSSDADKTTTTTTDSNKKKSKKTTSTKNVPPSEAVKDTTFVTRRIKVRAVENKAWQRMDPPGGGWGLFGWHTVPADAREIVVTEGEYDAMAVYQATGRPAVSLPNGCRSLPVEVLPILENMEKIYLWMDSDAAGQEGAEAFAKKLGLERTYIVRPTPMNTIKLDPSASSDDDHDPFEMPKDANEALLEGFDLKRIIETSKLIPHERIMTFENLRDDVLNEIFYPDKYAGTPISSLPGLTGLMQGLRRGELTVLTGPTGSGKTTFLGQVSLDLAEQGTNVLWGSFEIKNTRLMHKLLQQFAREPLPKGDLGLTEKMHAIADRFQQLPMYFLTFHGGSDVDQVLEAMDYAVYVNDVEHIILDNMQFMVSRKNMNKSFDKYDVQDVAIEKFRQFATERNVHVTLVVHPRKEAETEKLSMASIYGSAKASQEADTVLILQSQQGNKWVEVKKNRFNGELGKCPLYFDKSSCRYTNTPTSPGAGGSPPPSRPSATKRKSDESSGANHWDKIFA